MDWLLLKVQSLVVLLTVIRTSDCSTYSVQYSHPYVLTYAAGFQYFLTSRSYWKRFLWSHVNKERPGTSLKTVAFCDLLCFHLMILLYISVQFFLTGNPLHLHSPGLNATFGQPLFGDDASYVVSKDEVGLQDGHGFGMWVGAGLMDDNIQCSAVVLDTRHLHVLYQSGRIL